MVKPSYNPLRFWEELKRRKVVRVIIVYLASAFAILEATDIIFPRLGFPDWSLNLIIYILCGGLIITIVLSWIYDIIPDGVQKTMPVEEVTWEGKPATSNAWKITTYVTIVIILLLVAFNIASRSNRFNALSKLGKSIAVLPFENWSNAEKFSHLGDAIANEICTQSAKIQDFQVISFTSTSSYRGSDKSSIPQIGKELGANFIIEGSVERQDEDVSIHVQVIQAENNTHIWAEEFKGKWDDIFAIRAKIAVTIAEQLKTILSPEEIKEIEEESTTNAEAYNYYLRGNYYYDNYFSVEMFERAIEMYEEALESCERIPRCLRRD